MSGSNSCVYSIAWLEFSICSGGLSITYSTSLFFENSDFLKLSATLSTSSWRVNSASTSIVVFEHCPKHDWIRISSTHIYRMIHIARNYIPIYGMLCKSQTSRSPSKRWIKIWTNSLVVGFSKKKKQESSSLKNHLSHKSPTTAPKICCTQAHTEVYMVSTSSKVSL